MKYLLIVLFLTLGSCVLFSQSSHREVSRYEAPNASQAVAVDSLYFYTISNSIIIKRLKTTGEVVAKWKGPLKHLNSGAVINGKLYCANTNYPRVPMASSIEIFDCATLRHLSSHSFGHYIGSLTWIDRIEDDYLLMFVHYENEAMERQKGVAYSTLIRTDKEFRRKAGWTLPLSLTEHLKPTSISGGTVLPDGRLLLSPHHFEEVFVFDFPKFGYELEWIETISVPFQGQGIAFDHSSNSVWGMRRDTREVIQLEMVFSPVPVLLKDLHDPSQINVMVAAHRGDWRNAPENSLQAIQNCIDMGLDMVELDVRLTKDGIPVLMHDETIDRTTTGNGFVKDKTLAELNLLSLRNGANRPTIHRIPTLEEALLTARGKILINLDKCYGIFNSIYPILEKTGTTHQILMKGKVTPQQLKSDFGPWLDKILFMPIVDLEHPDASTIIKQFQKEMKPVAFELIFKNKNNPLIKTFSEIRQSGTHVWVNTLWESLNGGYEDDRAVQDPEGIYGWLIDHDVTIIQTDRPHLLLNHLKTQQLK